MGKPYPNTELHARLPIEFLHPGYPVHNILFSLPRVDSQNGTNSTIFGIFHRTALLACQIVAGNAFDGYFTLDQAGQHRVVDNLLTANQYYFVTGDNIDDPYPIVPSFRDWQFPHERIHNLWPPIPGSSTPIHRCGITNFSYAVDKAHLIPREEFEWYDQNDMYRYGASIDDSLNMVHLRYDLHRCFDNRWFAIIPKFAGTVAQSAENTTHILAPEAAEYTTHILAREAAELWPTYHDTIVDYLPSSCHPYLFARFAWAVIMRVKHFIVQGTTRQVIRVHNGDGTQEYRSEKITGAQLKLDYGGGRSKNATPKKTSVAHSVQDEVGHVQSSSSDDSNVNMDSDKGDVIDEWVRRGRAIDKASQFQVFELRAHLADILPGV